MLELTPSCEALLVAVGVAGWQVYRVSVLLRLFSNHATAALLRLLVIPRTSL